MNRLLPMLLGLALLPAAPAATQTAPQPAPQPPATSTEAAPEPDILLDVRVRAGEVRWRQTGDLQIRAWAEPGGLEIEESVTTGVPSPIPVGRTFRNIDWRLRAGARFADPASPAAATAEGSDPTND